MISRSGRALDMMPKPFDDRCLEVPITQVRTSIPAIDPLNMFLMFTPSQVQQCANLSLVMNKPIVHMSSPWRSLLSNYDRYWLLALLQQCKLAPFEITTQGWDC
jgi:hypothetical protein